ncbi:hypothetical protein ACFY5J_22620 [Peribacillus butanolivorans]
MQQTKTIVGSPLAIYSSPSPNTAAPGNTGKSLCVLATATMSIEPEW